MSEIQHIYWFAYFNEDSPSVRYRAKYPLDFFREQEGITSDLIIPGYHPMKVFRFLKAYFSALLLHQPGTWIVIQRVHSNFIYSSLLKLLVLVRKHNTVYDLDDADYLYCPPRSIYFFCKKCTYITAGSQEIANHLKAYNSNVIVTTSPTPDLGIYKQKKNDLFTIGWIGGFGGDHKKSMVEIVFPAIKELNFNCLLVLLGVTKPSDVKFIQDYFSDNLKIQLEIPTEVPWTNEAAIQRKIMQFDVGIATLLDNAVQRSKSGIKAKQYLNNGVPVLGTNLPENDWVIEDDKNGYFCSNTEDFKRRIEEFYSMKASDYQRFSENARRSIQHFDHRAYFNSFAQIATPMETIPMLDEVEGLVSLNK